MEAMRSREGDSDKEGFYDLQANHCPLKTIVWEGYSEGRVYIKTHLGRGEMGGSIRSLIKVEE